MEDSCDNERMSMDLGALTSFAHRLADASGRAILPHFRADALGLQNKAAGGSFDPVTIADREAEQALRALIALEYPEHGVLGEEYGLQRGRSALHWVLDPIDGTRAFISGAPQWGTLIALNDGARPVLGVLDQPYTGERWVGASGRTEFHAREGRRTLQTRRGIALKDAILTSTHPWSYFSAGEQQAFRSLDACARMTRFGGDCYAYGLLAMGCIDVVVEAGLKPWDIQALIPIIEGAGGCVTDWRGGDAQQGGQVVASGDPALHAVVLDRLRPATT
jgi:histidinol phosphatase-like enzyme (inositol monophosphatase family)